MFDLVGLLLRIGYYFGHAIGVTNFELDWRTGRVFTSTRSTLFAMANNLTIVIFIGLQFIERAKHDIVFGAANKLYAYVVILVTLLRVASGLAVLLNQWWYQSQLMILARKAIQLCLARPQLLKTYRWKILFKCVNSLLRDILPILFAIENSKHYTGLCMHLWTSAILNLVIAHYFLLMLCVRAHYILLNIELHQVIEESRILSCNISRKGSFMTKCCALADQLEDIAKLQSHLQSILDQVGVVFGVPKLVMYCCYYAASVVTSYSVFNIFKHGRKNLEISLRYMFLSFSWCLFFHTDAIHNLVMAFHVQDEHQKMIRLLSDRTLFAPGLDARLEESFESLHLQLIRNPLKLNVLQLFPINRQSSWSMFASIILHSICVVQYDLENFRKD